MTAELETVLTLRRVVNGWIILRGGPSVINRELMHVATTPEELASHVRQWAEAQALDAP